MRFEYQNHFIGEDTERAYASIFGKERIGGVGDGGKDVLTGDEEFPFIQVKSSWHDVLDFLAHSLRFAGQNGGQSKTFIPVCVGDPGTREEVMKSIRTHGGWIGKEIPNREKLLTNIQKARDIIEQASKGVRVERN